jgi:acetate kinase
MTLAKDNRILTINCGSSSLKIALFLMGKKETLELSAYIERIGLSAGHFHLKDGEGRTIADEHPHLSNHDTALNRFLKWLQKQNTHLDAAGHRVVQGGLHYDQPELITQRMEKALAKLEPLDPDHLTLELKAIKTVRRFYPDVTQVACFDTAFHRHMPTVAQQYPLPRKLWRDGLRRFGFHGLSYEFLIHELAGVAGAKVAHGRVIIAHLGSGASITAIRGGQSVDTTMGFTPTGGLMMGTRSGDLDPGVMLYLLREGGLSSSELSDLVNERAGLLGVSGVSSDLRVLFAQSENNPHAAEAIELFCYEAKKNLGALAAVLGGVDTLIFTAGIGENMPAIRRRICQHLEFLGIRLDPTRNERNAAVISRADSPVAVRVMKTNEELMIARHTRDLMGSSPSVKSRGAGSQGRTS